MLNREQQIELMNGAKERAIGYLRAWMTNKEFKDALHRYDNTHNDDQKEAYVR
tara:strand:- start:119886 stop:120044 length:159 start_codon:yes stop_codon:yes gene_type:complete